ncbi:nuclear transport factor 2 [Aphanothece hegewaldii CCALA 016]|uniref:Nuclear transport factor 2 n=1 Tax=Aphanothece hegewaldii CCALA 016 TaxID=2107694 RepID=A0A2T1LXF9_9CHRO|nr:nuclear transport factor 2 family protein [Aphanothece hegewaldii]PSF37070.1 nuclear transport factor 2 [Aphanothece hegewaldii CCALA 016]
MISTSQTTIEGITEPVILNYFNYLNAGDFEATANLFAPDGILQPPFESPIIGREAIADYLTLEGRGLELYPKQGSIEPTEDEQTKIVVVGNVKTPLLGVNVSWYFILTPNSEIAFAEIRLLASLQELLHLKK